MVFSKNDLNIIIEKIINSTYLATDRKKDLIEITTDNIDRFWDENTIEKYGPYDFCLGLIYIVLSENRVVEDPIEVVVSGSEYRSGKTKRVTRKMGNILSSINH